MGWLRGVVEEGGRGQFLRVVGEVKVQFLCVKLTSFSTSHYCPLLPQLLPQLGAQMVEQPPMLPAFCFVSENKRIFRFCLVLPKKRKKEVKVEEEEKG